MSHEYDSEKRGIEIRTPLKEVGGTVYKGGRKADDHHEEARKRPPARRGNARPNPWRRPNFRIRFWRPAWDGVELDAPGAGERRPPILPTFTFHEGRHTYATWLTEDRIPEVARRARLGQ